MTTVDFDAFLETTSSALSPRYGVVATDGKPAALAATVLDTFSQDCFAPELAVVPVSRVDFHQAFEYYDPQFLLIESAWNGSDGSWREQLVTPSGPRPDVHHLITTARDRDIPVVFWNKEDPPHFEEFLPVARLADYVFTTAGELVEDYVREVGHRRVDVLPFAAQPLLHHPFTAEKRDREICFAGQYFAHKFPERREQMAILFPAATAHDFAIYSRELGNDERHAFPSPYDQHVEGSLPYSQMVEAYRRFKVFLNVNSVIDSPTMCARRVFEISASGSVVVSAPTPAVSSFYAPDEVFTPADAAETSAVLGSLLSDDEVRYRSSLRAWRRTLTRHTYRHRVQKILAALGTTDHARKAPVTVVVDCRGQRDNSNLPVLADRLEMHRGLVTRQVHLVAEGQQIPDTGHDLVTLPEALEQLEGHITVIVSGSAQLGQNAIPDIVLASRAYSNRGVLAKSAYNDPRRLSYQEGRRGTPALRAVSPGSDLAAVLGDVDGRQVPCDYLDYFNVIDSRFRSYPTTNWEA